MTEDDFTFDLSRRRALGALGTIGVASAGAGLGTSAFFSDEETFEGNTLTAGQLDMKVDWEEHYSDWSDDEAEGLGNPVLMPNDDVPTDYVGLPVPSDPLIYVHQDDLAQFMDNTSIEAMPDTNDDGVQDDLSEFDICSLPWDTPEILDPNGPRTDDGATEDITALDDGTPAPLVYLRDVKPGDFGELTLSFHLCDNDGYVWLTGELTENAENGLTEPESEDEDENGGEPGELADAIRAAVWYDDDCDNVLDGGAAQETDVATVFDVSGSMNEDTENDATSAKLNSAKDGAQALVNALDDDDNAALSPFDTGNPADPAENDNVDLTQTNAAGTTTLTNAIEGLSTGGSEVSTNIHAGIIDATEELLGAESGFGGPGSAPFNNRTTSPSGAPRNPTKVLVVLSDGLPSHSVADDGSVLSNGGSYSSDDPADNPAAVRAIEGAEVAKANGIRVITIGYGIDDIAGSTQQARATLQQIASSNADFYEAPTPADVEDVFGTIAESVTGEEVIFEGPLTDLFDRLDDGNGLPLDPNPSTDTRECFEASTTRCIGFAWWLPVDHANEIQTDSVGFDLGFYTEQCRHNSGAGLPGRTETPQTATGSVVQRTTEEVPEPPEPSGDPVAPPEGYPVSEEEFEELKERASDGELVQPPSGAVQEEGGPATGEQVQAQQQQQLSLGRNFDGWRNAEVRSTPPDPNIAVGPEKVVLGVNRRWGIYDKDTGDREFEVLLEDWFDPVTEENEDFVFDPKAQYDHQEGRFVVIAVARDDEGERGSWVVAVSDDDDPFGTWWITRIPQAGDSTWPDYPGLGVDANGIYLTAKVFDFAEDEEFQYTQLVTVDKTPLYNGNSFTYWWFDDLRNPDGSRAWCVQPTHAMTSTGSQYLVNSKWDTGDSLTLWELTNPTSDPRLRSRAVDVGSYSLPPDAEQPNTGSVLEALDARLMNAVYENGSVWTVHSISYDWNDDGDASAILKWYEIDAEDGSVTQSRGWGRPDADYFFPAIASDGESTAVVYNESDSDSVFPRIEVAGRTAAHTQNSLQDVLVVRDGESSYTADGDVNRWGDYSGIGVDPSLGSYWGFGEYAPGAGATDDWETYVGEVFFGEIIG